MTNLDQFLVRLLTLTPDEDPLDVLGPFSDWLEEKGDKRAVWVRACEIRPGMKRGHWVVDTVEPHVSDLTVWITLPLARRALIELVVGWFWIRCGCQEMGATYILNPVGSKWVCSTCDGLGWKPRGTVTQ